MFIRLGFIFLFLMNMGLSNIALAESKYSIKQMTPEVEAALEGRRNRYDQVRQFKDQGIVGENNRGYVEVLIQGEGAEGLVKEENADRKMIYETIARQNNLEGALETIEKVFAQVRRDKANPGDKIQEEDGAWAVK